MAFMQPPAARTDEDRFPVLAFNAKAGRLFLFDRMQRPDGEWYTLKTDVTMTQPAFAVDFGNLETGWVYFANAGAPQFSMAFYGQPMPAQPAPAGFTTEGKPLRFKAGFRVPCIGQAIGGVRELRGNAVALIAGMNELHTQYEESDHGRAGAIPLVQMTDAVPIQSSQGANFQPVFTVVRYVARPKDLGPRTVALPGAQATQPPRTAPRLVTATHASAPAQGWDDAPTDDRWDEPAQPRRQAAATRNTGPLAF